MKTKIFLGMLLVGVVPLRAQDYYVVTKENVDVYQYPAAGEVVGKVGTMNSFTAWEAGDGWMEFKTPVVSGCVPAKYLRKTAHGEFSRAMLGDYIGKAPAPVSYSTATLSEKEGYVVLQLTDLSSRTAKAAKAVRRVMCMSAYPVTMVSRSRTAFIHTSAMNLWLYRWKEAVR